MAEIADGFPTRSRYPWDEWLDGRVWKLTRGDDFTNQTNTFRQQVRNSAQARGMDVKVSVRGDDVYVQAVRRG